MATTARRDDGVGAGISWVQQLVAGMIGGVVGGLAFGALMAMMGMLPMVASILGSKSAVVGFLYHMFNSVVIGALFGLILGGLSHTYARGATYGLLYGVVWWVLGPIILMPLLLGMGSEGIASQFGAAFSAPMLMSLIGHLIYGLLTGLVYVAYATSRLARRATEGTA
jgi:uncharacterized membrane protein YagU involved in acid resistance